MLTSLINFKTVVNYLYGNMAETSKLRDRCPQPTTWRVAELVAQELDYPCKVVIKAQDQGHWFLLDAIHRCTALWKHMSVTIAKLIAEAETKESLEEERTQ